MYKRVHANYTADETYFYNNYKTIHAIVKTVRDKLRCIEKLILSCIFAYLQ